MLAVACKKARQMPKWRKTVKNEAKRDGESGSDQQDRGLWGEDRLRTSTPGHAAKESNYTQTCAKCITKVNLFFSFHSILNSNSGWNRLSCCCCGDKNQRMCTPWWSDRIKEQTRREEKTPLNKPNSGRLMTNKNHLIVKIKSNWKTNSIHTLRVVKKVQKIEQTMMLEVLVAIG